LGEVPVPLKAGLRYAQLFIHTADAKIESSAEGASFLGSTKPSIGTIDFDEIEFVDKLKGEPNF